MASASVDNPESEHLRKPVNPSFSGITFKDIRDAVIKMPHVPKIEYVRVSDSWWVCLEDGKPISSSPHNDLMKAIDSLNTKVT